MFLFFGADKNRLCKPENYYAQYTKKKAGDGRADSLPSPAEHDIFPPNSKEQIAGEDLGDGVAGGPHQGGVPEKIRSLY